MIRIVKIDETQHWRADIQAACGKLWGVYVYDDTARTFCCELTPSRELVFCGSTWERSPDDESEAEKLAELINEADGQQELACYMWCSEADRLPFEPFDTDEPGFEDGDTYPGPALSAALEWCRGNGVVG